MSKAESHLSRRLLIAIVLAASGFVAVWHHGTPVVTAETSDRRDSEILQAYEERSGGIWVSGEGVTIRILADDNDGSRHQRFIIELQSGHTLLMAHNIDLAPRIASLQIGDTVGFNGVYEWNTKGGVIHWTHHDPQGRHDGGWLRHQGRIYR